MSLLGAGRRAATHLTRRGFLAGCAALGASGASGCTSTTPSDAGDAGDAGELPLDVFVTEQLALAKLPGLSAAIVKGGKLALLRHYGAADLEARRAPADDTAFFLASLSKTTTGIGAMRLVEAGKLALDEDVNTYLPFKVRNPRFPEQKITTRHLMTHTSGVHETGVRLLSLAKPGDPTTSLQELLEPYLVPGGATYVAGESYSPEVAPGQRFLYSNFGAALVGLVIERVSGKPFAAYMRDEVFAKLGLVNTGFSAARSRRGEDSCTLHLRDGQRPGRRAADERALPARHSPADTGEGAREAAARGGARRRARRRARPLRRDRPRDDPRAGSGRGEGQRHRRARPLVGAPRGGRGAVLRPRGQLLRRVHAHAHPPRRSRRHHPRERRRAPAALGHPPRGALGLPGDRGAALRRGRPARIARPPPGRAGDSLGRRPPWALRPSS
ncbi:MAG: beta-lactamase family protein [Myxococcales bacterium]|nr:beta-lactamase family protein [Myxococcales bacterium]